MNPTIQRDWLKPCPRCGADAMVDCRHKDGGPSSFPCELPNPEAVIVDRWRDGDPRCHCTHCEACGSLFRTEDIGRHMVQAHLGSKYAHDRHRDNGCQMLTLVAAGRRPRGLDEWLETEARLREVEEFVGR